MRRINVRGFVLMFLIVLSLVLTGFIFSGRSFVPRDDRVTSNNKDSEVALQSEVRVLTPSQIIYHHDQEIDMINTQSLFQVDAQDLFAEEVLINLRQVDETVVAQDAFAMLEGEDTIVYTFDSLIPFSIYGQLFEELDDSDRSKTFNFIFFPKESHDRVHFYNSDTETLYTADSTGEYLQSFLEEVKVEETEKRPVSLFFVGGTPLYLPSEPVRLSYSDYLLNRIPNSAVVDRLFKDLSEVNLRSYSTYVNYWDFESSLRIEDQSNLMTYREEDQGQPSLTVDEILTQGFDALNQYENWSQGLHLNEIDMANEQISFRRYLKGYPLFAKNGEDVIVMGFSDESLLFLQMSLSVAETPIDAHQEDYYKSLSSGFEVIERINRSKINHSLVESLRIGLTWNYSDKTNRVVHFVPDWYIRYDGEWHNLQEFLED